MSRRTFLFLSSAAAVTAIVAPKLLLPDFPVQNVYARALPLDVIAAQTERNDLDSLLMQIYEPVIREQLNEPNTIMRFMAMDDDPAALRVMPIKIWRNWATGSRRVA